ncbi:16S rRNA (uracil(1498)-N(3))-methyltransferase [Enterococcus sp. JM4C]|uniref:16S rRNA (uracil(1498)-N(3))-methyltransferase n=1 Tax=Candidatus Enterococcus huntleyi TaxID=1857217 RepID=UPI00137A3FC5|nr:16S rRNA (uracil(1498)-N(3))-methyltransferase [Enterococcus sp. JM4C]KAF1299114.1 16S rRNA (uracil(1498)-N(3))-methyltransferase [Enterococcus sp. JM4C]
MQRYFVEENYTGTPTFEIQGENYHHIVRVMRMKPEDQVYLVFENQVSVIAEISEITEESVFLTELEKELGEKELPSQLTIASGYPKGDKLEWIVQKGTELGAHAFVGFPADASVVKWDGKKLAKKQQRLEKIAKEAAEQSHRQYAPKLQLFEHKNEFYNYLKEFDAVIVAYEESAKQGEQAKLAQVLQSVAKGSRVLAIFGPEGGLSPKEIEIFEEANAVICGLGPRILRTETAPLYLLSAASYQWELL